MSGVTIALILFGCMLLLMALRVPIAMSMMVPGVLGYIAIAGAPCSPGNLPAPLSPSAQCHGSG